MRFNVGGSDKDKEGNALNFQELDQEWKQRGIHGGGKSFLELKSAAANRLLIGRGNGRMSLQWSERMTIIPQAFLVVPGFVGRVVEGWNGSFDREVKAFLEIPFLEQNGKKSPSRQG